MKNKFNTVWLFSLLLLSASNYAGVIASATRVIFNQGDNAQSLMLVNTNDYPVIVQTWVDDGKINSSPALAKTPFISLPVIFTMKPQQMSGIKIVFKPSPLASDRESVYWLNLYEVPPAPPQKPPYRPSMLLALNTQMKIFYRPQALKSKAKRALHQVSFSLKQHGQQYQLICHNDSPFYLSFAHLALRVAGQSYPVQQQSDMMTPPYSSKAYDANGINDNNINAIDQIQASIINDQGQQLNQYYPLKTSR